MFRFKNYTKIKKDYQAKNLHNPFFKKKKSSSGRRYWRLLLILGILILLALAWFFIAAPFWYLKGIDLEGFSRVSPLAVEEIIWQQTEGKRWLIFPEKNILWFDGQKAANKIIEDHNLSACEVKKKRFSRRLKIIAQERPYAFIWQERSELFYASRDAYIIRGQVVSEADKNKYFILENKNPGTLIGDRDKLQIKEKYLQFAFSLYQNLIEKPELSLDRFIIDWEFNTLKVKFINGPLVYFNTEDSSTDQLERLLLVKNEKIKDNFSKTDYIDLRYGDRIFINPDFN